MENTTLGFRSMADRGYIYEAVKNMVMRLLRCNLDVVQIQQTDERIYPHVKKMDCRYNLTIHLNTGIEITMLYLVLFNQQIITLRIIFSFCTEHTVGHSLPRAIHSRYHCHHLRWTQMLQTAYTT